jgi:TonB-linked SusC/RagA family outer membrane protein
MNGRKWMNLLAVLSVGALHAESVFATASSTVKSVEVRQANQQKNVVKGTVTDESGLPVPGASVVVVGTTEGTVTDMDGAYSLALSRNRAVLRFSFIGLKSVDVEYTGQRVLNVVLKSDNQVLDDVVVIGYGSKNRKSLTSSISSVKKDDLNKLSKTSSTVQDMLGGTIKGVLVTQNSGEPGATMTVNVRGITSPYPISTSLTANNAPLYVIDGVPMFVDSNALNPLMNIAPNDIESIDVLKDASATAIYGSRGANGVIIVTTKNGRKGEKATVEAGYTLSIANPVKVFEPLNNQEFRSLQEEILRNTMDAYNYDMANFTMTTQYSMMYDPTILMAYGNFEVDWNTLMYTKFLGLNESAFGKENINWEDETRNKNAITNQYNVSVRGGSEKTDYSFAFNAIDQEGLYKNDNLETYSGRLSVNTDITKRIRMGALLSYSYSKRTSPSQESIMAPDTHPWLVRPDLPVYDENGDYTRLDKGSLYFMPSGYVSGPNPVALLNRKAKYESDQFMGNVYVDIELLRNLKFHSDFTLASYNYDNSYFSPSYLQEI